MVKRIILHFLAAIFPKLAQNSFFSTFLISHINSSLLQLIHLIDDPLRLCLHLDCNDINVLKLRSCIYRTCSLLIDYSGAHSINKREFEPVVISAWSFLSACTPSESPKFLMSCHLPTVLSCLKFLCIAITTYPSLVPAVLWFHFFPTTHSSRGLIDIFLEWQSLDYTKVIQPLFSLIILSLKANRLWLRNAIKQPPGFSFTSLSDKMAESIIIFHEQVFFLCKNQNSSIDYGQEVLVMHPIKIILALLCFVLLDYGDFSRFV